MGGGVIGLEMASYFNAIGSKVSVVEMLEKHGLRVSGRHPESGLVEVVELPGERFFVATQAHPEFKSRPLRPHPLFLSFMDAALGICQQALTH